MPCKIRKNGFVALDVSTCSITDELENISTICYGYKRSIFKTVIYVITCFLSGGFTLLLSYWKPNWHLFITHSQCALSNCTTVLLIDQFNFSFVENVIFYTQQKTATHRLINIVGIQDQSYRYFYHKHLKYVFDDKNSMFTAVKGLDNKESFYSLHLLSEGLSDEIRTQSLVWNGPNIIDVDVLNYFQLFCQECANPFYIFQVFSCLLWFFDDYYYYACAIVFISMTSICISIYETRKQLITLRSMIASSAIVSILQPSGNVIEINSESLVPGDVLVLPKFGGTLFCDAALVSGTVIVNESMLTGESVPVTKTPIAKIKENDSRNKEVYNTIKHKRNTLFCGTEILQTRYYGDEKVLAVVVKTGFTTLKGELIRSILFPKPVDFKFYTDALKFVGVLCLLALLGFAYTVYVFVNSGSSIGVIIKKSLDVVTIAVPPALPAAMSVGIVYALQRLIKNNIYCISPSRINISGRLNMFCFDKTGTLTEDGLDFYGVMRSHNNRFLEINHELNDSNDHTIIAMATCHSLTTINGEICGDTLDIKMFNATNWILEESGVETENYENIVPIIVKPQAKAADSVQWKYLGRSELPLEVAIIKQFTFSSELQRMSVVTRALGSKHMNVYAKGSPEMIASLCLSSSIPNSFDENLTSIAREGYRVIALAYKKLPKKIHWHKVQHFNRSEAECDLNFLGLLIMKNVLKPETAPVIEKLYSAQIRVVMVTGDNILTAVSVARECGIVPPCHKILSIVFSNKKNILQFMLVGQLDDKMDEICPKEALNCLFLKRNYHLAVTGKVFQVIQQQYPMLYKHLLVCGTIFARMLPDQKTSLVEGLQNMEYVVGMCGDGANDCGALKRAHAGISLSEAEASVASPFTSKIQNISCVLQVIKEGRCALVTSFNIFKFMALYSMIEYCSVLMLYSISSNLGDLQFLYIDLFIITPFAVTMGRTGPTNCLTPHQPLGNLIHPRVLFSLIMQIFTQVCFQIFLFFYVKTIKEYLNVDQFKPKDWLPGVDVVVNFENTIIFIASCFQYIIVALIFSPGNPHRKPFYKNLGLMLSTVVFIVANCVLAVKPHKFLMKQFQLLSIDDLFYYEVLFGSLLCNFLVSYLIDYHIVNSKILQRLFVNICGKNTDKKEYKSLMNIFVEEPDVGEYVENPIC